MSRTTAQKDSLLDLADQCLVLVAAWEQQKASERDLAGGDDEVVALEPVFKRASDGLKKVYECGVSVKLDTQELDAVMASILPADLLERISPSK